MAKRCSLYYITDRKQFDGDEETRRRRLLAKIAEAAQAGVDYIQLREKDLTSRELEALAGEALAAVHNGAPLRTENQELRTISQPSTRLLINSRADIALVAGADGVHLRAGDVSPHDVREILRAAHRPPTTAHFLIAVSFHSADDVLRAEAERVDFTVFAPVFEKKTAPATPATGLDALREACRANIPVLALGGVTLDNAKSCLDAGAAGIAGIRLFQEHNIAHVVRALRNL
jgi:thiamine-phosphate pyrophosphorylase